MAIACLALGLLPGTHSSASASDPESAPSTPAPAGDPAPVRPDGLGLEIPESVASRGVVYHLLPGRAVQATFQSTTPIETFQGQTDAIVGYAVVSAPGELAALLESSPQAERGALLGAEFALPVDSIRTGIEMRDRHLRTRQWLHESDHPSVRFRLAYFADPRDATPERAPEGSRTVRGELVGDMTIRGVTRPLRIPQATIAMLPESETTRRVADGDLLAIRCRYTLKLSDFGIENAIVGRQVSDEIEIDQVLYFSTVPPHAEDQSSDESGSSAPESDPPRPDDSVIR